MQSIWKFSDLSLSNIHIGLKKESYDKRGTWGNQPAIWGDVK